MLKDNVNATASRFAASRTWKYHSKPDVVIDQVCHREPRWLIPGFPQAVHVRDAVRNVLASAHIPKAANSRTDLGLRRACSATCTSTLAPSVSFTSSSGLKTPVLVFGGDSHDVRPRDSKDIQDGHRVPTLRAGEPARNVKLLAAAC